MTKRFIFICCVLLFGGSLSAQELTAKQILEKVTSNKQGETLYSEVTMTIVRRRGRGL